MHANSSRNLANSGRPQCQQVLWKSVNQPSTSGSAVPPRTWPRVLPGSPASNVPLPPMGTTTFHPHLQHPRHRNTTTCPCLRRPLQVEPGLCVSTKWTGEPMDSAPCPLRDEPRSSESPPKPALNDPCPVSQSPDTVCLWTVQTLRNKHRKYRAPPFPRRTRPRHGDALRSSESTSRKAMRLQPQQGALKSFENTRRLSKKNHYMVCHPLFVLEIAPLMSLKTFPPPTMAFFLLSRNVRQSLETIYRHQATAAEASQLGDQGTGRICQTTWVGRSSNGLTAPQSCPDTQKSFVTTRVHQVVRD